MMSLIDDVRFECFWIDPNGLEAFVCSPL